MKKAKLLAAAAKAVAFSVGSANADGEMEKCKVVDENGKGLIKEHKADCAGNNNSCAGHNSKGDPDAWIMVPKGECDKVNKGDFSGVDDTIKDKIEMDN